MQVRLLEADDKTEANNKANESPLTYNTSFIQEQPPDMGVYLRRDIAKQLGHSPHYQQYGRYFWVLTVGKPSLGSKTHCLQYVRDVAGTSRTKRVALPEQTWNNWAHQSSAWETSGNFFPLKIASAGSTIYSIYILYIVYSNKLSLTWARPLVQSPTWNPPLLAKGHCIVKPKLVLLFSCCCSTSLTPAPNAKD